MHQEKEPEKSKEQLDRELDRLLEEDYIDQGNPNAHPVGKKPAELSKPPEPPLKKGFEKIKKLLVKKG